MRRSWLKSDPPRPSPVALRGNVRGAARSPAGVWCGSINCMPRPVSLAPAPDALYTGKANAAAPRGRPLREVSGPIPGSRAAAPPGRSCHMLQDYAQNQHAVAKKQAQRGQASGTSRRPMRPHSRVLSPVPWSCCCRAACLPLQHDPPDVGSCVLRPAACEMPAPNLAAYRGASFTETSIIWMPTSPQEPTMA